MATPHASRRRRAPRGEGHLLREEILRACRELVAELGSFDAVSVRAVAQRVGVSTPALYLHFADKDALVEATCELVFAELDEEMQSAVKDLGEDPEPLAELRANAEAYVRFALSHPEEYRVVLMRPPGHVVDTKYILDTVTHQRLVKAIVRCQDAGLLAPDAAPLAVSLALWGSVHGAVSLFLARPVLQEWADPVEMSLAVASVTVAGIAAIERLGYDSGAVLGGDLQAADLAGRLDAALGPPSSVLHDLQPPPLAT